MWKKSVALAAAGLLAGCATTKTGEGAAPTTEKMRITNQSYFDLANCSPRKVEVPKPATKESVIGFLVSARPQVMECFVNPKHRGPASETVATVMANVTDAAVSYEVSGQNLTPEGTQCVQQLFAARGGLEPLPKGATAISEKAEFHHVLNLVPSVVFGTNEASDVVGNIRLQQANWCDCYTSWAAEPPRILSAKIKLSGSNPIPETTFEPMTDTASNVVAACIQQKLAATPIPVKASSLELPYRFVFVHSGISQDIPDAPSEIQFIQLEQVRAQRSADAVIALGARQNAATSYDALVQKYQKTKDAKLVKDLESGCAALGRANDAWIKALAGQLDVDKRTLSLISSLKEKDAQWGEAETKAQQTVAGSEKDVADAKKVKEQNTAICPKKRY